MIAKRVAPRDFISNKLDPLLIYRVDIAIANLNCIGFDQLMSPQCNISHYL